jgi:N-methylhydantoinase A
VSPGGVRVAVDIGGTFTDIVVMSGDGVLHESKISTTPDDPSRAVVAGLQALLAELGIPATRVEEVLHGTTVGSNTILQRTGARTGLITTRGFRDVLEIGRIRMPDMFDLTWDKPKPLVPRRHRLEVAERIAADGSIIEPLVEASVVASSWWRPTSRRSPSASSTATAIPRTSSGSKRFCANAFPNCW